jgi:hypothetical protein
MPPPLALPRVVLTGECGPSAYRTELPRVPRRAVAASPPSGPAVPETLAAQPITLTFSYCLDLFPWCNTVYPVGYFVRISKNRTKVWRPYFCCGRGVVRVRFFDKKTNGAMGKTDVKKKKKKD